METRTVVHDELCVTVTEPRWGDERKQLAIGAKLNALSLLEEGKPIDGYAAVLEGDLVEFSYAVAQVIDHSGFDLPSPLDPQERVCSAFEAISALPAKFVKDWFEAAAILRGAKGDPDVATPDQLSEAKKKTRASKPNG